ncbi:MAG: sodium:solute symporter family protein [Candidatus Latescibacteria bacterium]|jgi:solute:Na+ symporter, SSS family|nr:sodium:solute symporter family protein [Candidatus Latescibacterota bacterium]
MSEMPFGPGALLFIGLYLAAMIGTGYWAQRQRKGNTLSDFYLAGKGLGGLVLLLTLYATQYSGNTLLAYPGESFRLGFLWIMSVGFMMSIVVVYLLFAPDLHRISKEHRFVTPGDWIDHRFGSPSLTLVASILFVVAISNYLLAQLMAMGHVVSGLSGNSVPFWAGVIVLGLIIIVYETMGGMQAVAWTDTVQGIILIVGLTGLLIAVIPGPERMTEVSEWIISNMPSKASVPSGGAIRTWISTIILVGFGAAVYPQAIQRIFAARSSRALQRSLGVMAFMPLITMLAVFFVGIIGIPQLSAMEHLTPDQVMPILLRQWALESTWMYIMTVLVVTGVLAAVMSTADSVLLSLSSILAKDILGKGWMSNVAEERLTRIGKRISWGIMGILMMIALVPRLSLWGLIELKMEILVQTAPLFILGIIWSRFSGRAAMAGLVTGTLVASALTLSGFGKVWGWHAGVLGLACNVVICFLVTQLIPDTRPFDQEETKPIGHPQQIANVR